jgi:hypothetical protein
LGPRRWLACFVICALCSAAAAAQTPNSINKTATARAAVEAKIALETSESVFAVLSAINSCGFDYELSSSQPARAAMRTEIEQSIAASAEAQQAKQEACDFYATRQKQDAAQTLSGYVSLALNLTPAPKFAVAGKEADLPPDVQTLVAFIPKLQAFYDAANLHAVWAKHQPEFESQVDRLHQPVADMIRNTDLYLRLPLSGYANRRFVVYVALMGAPGQVNARNYGADYFLVITPGSDAVRMDEIRHTYLHYILDTMIGHRGTTLKRLEPLLDMVGKAPLDDSYKKDMGLMTEESLIRAIEARTMPAFKGAKDVEAEREASAQASMEQGFILTKYFFDALKQFEKSPTGFQNSLGDMLHGIDLGTEQKRISRVVFSTKAAPDVVRASNAEKGSLLDQAEAQLAEGNAQSAQMLADRALGERTAEAARAYFILARARTLQRDAAGARMYFQKTIETGKDPRVLAWSNIYLGRILDLSCDEADRVAAVQHYHAALKAGDPAADTKAAAEKGLSGVPDKCKVEADPKQ